MAIAVVSSGGAAASSHAAPSVAEGNILIVAAQRRLSPDIPSLPGDFTNIASNSVGGQDSFVRVGYKVAGPGGFTGTSTWTNAQHVAWIQYSGQKISGPIGLISNVANGSSNTFVNLPARSLSPGETGQWMIGVLSRGETSSIMDNNATGMPHRVVVAVGGSGTDYTLSLRDTNGIQAIDWPSTNITGAAIGGTHIGITFELLAEGGSVSGVKRLVDGNLILSKLLGRLFR